MSSDYNEFDHYQEYINVLYKINRIIDKAQQNIKSLIKRKESEDEFNQEVVTQMYLIEMMIESKKEECYFYLGGKYSEAVNDEFHRLKKQIEQVNDHWKKYRKRFK